MEEKGENILDSNILKLHGDNSNNYELKDEKKEKVYDWLYYIELPVFEYIVSYLSLQFFIYKYPCFLYRY